MKIEAKKKLLTTPVHEGQEFDERVVEQIQATQDQVD